MPKPLPQPARVAAARTGRAPPVVGMVGAGQLARMTCEAASALGLAMVVLAEHPSDSAAAVAHEVLVGSPQDEHALRSVAARADVLTFDHEQVDLGALRALERDGVAVRPGTATLDMAVDKSEMRRRLERAGLPVPAFRVLGVRPAADALAAVEEFAHAHGWPVVVKAARGGYDGKGVWPVAESDEAAMVCERAATAGVPLLLEELVEIDAELATVVARGTDGVSVSWPTVETAQVDGVCREVLFPGRLDPDLARRAGALGREVADAAGVVGVLAIELFWSGGRLLVNEVAARPHNSAHWTIEGAVTSQFENHLRAVLELPLGDTSPAAPHIASVNVFGATHGTPPHAGLRLALAVPGAHVHLYGKEPRPGRKLGHVTVCGEDPTDVRARAWAAARALGTPVPPGLGPTGEDGDTARIELGAGTASAGGAP